MEITKLTVINNDGKKRTILVVSCYADKLAEILLEDRDENPDSPKEITKDIYN
jgi:hypothetical protein